LVGALLLCFWAFVEEDGEEEEKYPDWVFDWFLIRMEGLEVNVVNSCGNWLSVNNQRNDSPTLWSPRGLLVWTVKGIVILCRFNCRCFNFNFL
jgi:hypothetical protein